MKTSIWAFACAVTFCGLLVAAGCNDDPAAPETGTFTINPEPNSINAPWQLTGPSGYANSGNGDMILANMDAGNYTITWGSVAGWEKPNPAVLTQTLAENGTLTFIGTYAASNGSAYIDAEPNNIGAPWLLTGPDGYSHAGNGDVGIFGNLSAGTYTLTWGAVDGYDLPTPSMSSQTLAANGSVSFDGEYAPIAGTIVIESDPNTVAASWQLLGPYGYVLDGSDDRTLPNMVVGTYTLTWGAVIGYDEPATETVSLSANQAVTFYGSYVRQQLPFPDTPDKLMANFQTVYEQMDYSEFMKMNHPNYLMILKDTTYNEFPDVGPTLDVNEELRIHERMFSSQDVTDPLGSLVPGVRAIQFQAFIRQSSWSTSPPNDLIPNGDYALYNVVLLFDRGQSYSTLKVQGSIKFYATHRDSVVSGVTKPYYQMYGQIDLTPDLKDAEAGAKAIEGVAWGSVKALFR